MNNYVRRGLGPYTDKQIKDIQEGNERLEKKGKKGLDCNTITCQQPDAIYYNSGTKAYYCKTCAIKINDFLINRNESIVCILDTSI